MQTVVLGTHRSGTSLVTMLLQRLGMEVGDSANIDEKSSENPTGFWEHTGVRNLNELLLARTESAWDRPLNFLNGKLDAAYLERFGEEAAAIVRDLNAFDHWVIKDPRLCLTYTHWAPLLDDPLLVWVVRDPLEVAISLRTRNDFPLDVGLALHETYYQSMIDSPADADRFVIVDYAELLNDPSTTVHRLADEISKSPVAPPIDDERLAHALEAVNPDYYRSRRKPLDGIDPRSELHRSFDVYRRLRAGALEGLRGHSVSEDSLATLSRHDSVYRLNRYRILKASSSDLQPNSGHYDDVIQGFRESESELRQRLRRSADRIRKFEASHAAFEQTLRDEKAARLELERELARVRDGLSSLEHHSRDMSGEREQLRRQLAEAEMRRTRAVSSQRRLRRRIDQLKLDLDLSRARFNEFAELASAARDSLTALVGSMRWRLGSMAVAGIDRVLLRGRRPTAVDHLEQVLTELSRGVPGHSPLTILEEGVAARVAPTILDRDVKARLGRPGWEGLRKLLGLLYPAFYRVWEQENAASMRGYIEARESMDRITPRVMIGTLFSGENEFDTCVASVGRQSYTNIIHHVIRNLPNKEAHDRLYSDFLDSDCDILIKVDADMVLVEETFVARVVEVLKARPRTALMQMAILDFYSGGEIQGVNAYTRDLSWSGEDQHALFTDVTQTPPEARFVVWGSFARSVIHSPNPGLFQAFHFGAHRGIKALCALDEDAQWRAKEQITYLERTFQHLQVRRSPELLMACLGAELAFRGKFSAEDVDYTNDHLATVFRDFEGLSRDELWERLETLRAETLEDERVEALRARREAHARRPRLRSILFVLPHFRIFGGVNRFFEIARAASGQGIRAVVAAPRLNRDQLKRVAVDFPSVESCDLETAMAESWDCVMCGDFSSTLMASLPWFDARMSAVYLLNGWQHRHLNNHQIQLAQPDIVLANSGYAARHYPEWAPVTVPGAIDLSVFQPATEPRPALGRPLKLCVPGGRDKPRKRLKDGLACARILHERGVELELHVLDAQQYDLDEPFPCVVHSGLKRAEVAALMRSTDIMLCPEEDAGWNNPAAEALACGTPLVCTPAGTVDFARNEDTAMVVPPRSPEAMADAVERLVNDDDLRLRLAEQGLDAIRQFTWAALTRQLVDVLESCRFDESGRKVRNARARHSIIDMIESGTVVR